jgi:superkiller protein 3
MRKSLVCLLSCLMASGLTLARADEAADLIAEGEAQLEGGELVNAVDSLERAVEADPDSAYARLRLGGAYLLQRRYNDAIAILQGAIGLEPTNAAAFSALGLAYLHQGRYGEARAALEEAKRLDPAKAEDVDRILSGLEAAPAPSDAP